MNRHATDRWDWKIIAECPNNGEHVEGETDPNDPEHITIEASAENSEFRALEAVPVKGEECGICGSELDVIVQEEQTEVLH